MISRGSIRVPSVGPRAIMISGPCGLLGRVGAFAPAAGGPGPGARVCADTPAGSLTVGRAAKERAARHRHCKPARLGSAAPGSPASDSRGLISFQAPAQVSRIGRWQPIIRFWRCPFLALSGLVSLKPPGSGLNRKMSLKPGVSPLSKARFGLSGRQYEQSRHP